MLIRFFVAFKKAQSGATAVEYALIAGGIALAFVADISLIGGADESTITEAGSGL